MSRNLEEQFELREAGDQDKNWIIELAVELAEVAVPPLRGVRGESARRFARDSIIGLLPYSKTGGLWWPSISRAGRVGCLILNRHHEGPFEERETYIEDMGVVSDYLGRRVVHYLTDQAARISAEARV